MSNIVKINDSYLTSIANTIRAGEGSSSLYNINTIVNKIEKWPEKNNLGNCSYSSSNITAYCLIPANTLTNMSNYRNNNQSYIIPACSLAATNMYDAYYYCLNAVGSPACGNNVTYMGFAYYYCSNLTGSPVIGPNVTNMCYTYYYCSNLTGSPVIGPNVTDKCSRAYSHCYNLTGSPVCGDIVTSLSETYCNCYNLTGSPVCGPNVTWLGPTIAFGDIKGTYAYCTNLTGSPVCGPNVTDMESTYQNCYNLAGPPVCGPNVISMVNTYINDSNIYGDLYIYNNNINCYYYSYNGTLYDNYGNFRSCFMGRNTSNRLNIYVNAGSVSNSTLYKSNIYNSSNIYFSWSIVNAAFTWTLNSSNNCYYNTQYNLYCYYVPNVYALKNYTYDWTYSNGVTIHSEYDGTNWTNTIV